MKTDKLNRMAKERSKEKILKRLYNQLVRMKDNEKKSEGVSGRIVTLENTK